MTAKLLTDLAAAEQELADARAAEDALRRRVAVRQDGAASLATAQWRLHRARQRVDLLRSRLDLTGDGTA